MSVVTRELSAGYVRRHVTVRELPAATGKLSDGIPDPTSASGFEVLLTLVCDKEYFRTFLVCFGLFNITLCQSDV